MKYIGAYLAWRVSVGFTACVRAYMYVGHAGWMRCDLEKNMLCVSVRKMKVDGATGLKRPQLLGSDICRCVWGGAMAEITVVQSLYVYNLSSRVLEQRSSTFVIGQPIDARRGQGPGMRSPTKHVSSSYRIYSFSKQMIRSSCNIKMRFVASS